MNVKMEISKKDNIIRYLKLALTIVYLICWICAFETIGMLILIALYMILAILNPNAVFLGSEIGEYNTKLAMKGIMGLVIIAFAVTGYEIFYTSIWRESLK